MKNLSPRPQAAKIFGLARAALLLSAALFLSLPLRAQQPAQTKTGAQSRELTHTNETTKVTKLASESNRYAIIIGVNKYQDQEIPRLIGAANDAENLKRALIGHAGFHEDHIQVLTSNQAPEGQPTKRNILLAIGRLKGLIPDDGLLLISYAGHGIEVKGNAYLLPEDIILSEEDLRDTAIPVNELKERIAATGAGQVIMILDACRDNPMTGGRGAGGDNKQPQAFVDAFKFAETNKKIKANVTLYAASAGERAWEYKPKDEKDAYGYYTKVLVEALTTPAATNAAANDEGYVTLKGLTDYLKTEVPRRVQFGVMRSDAKQNPRETIDTFDAGNLIIATVTPKPKPVQAVAPTESANGVRIAAPGPPAPTTGSLTLKTTVAGVKLRLETADGGLAKEYSLPDNKQDAHLSEIKPGTYTAVISRDGYETEKYPVEIKAGEDKPLLVTPKLKTFSVTISANIATGSISYKAVGEANRHITQIQEFKGNIEPLPKGTYEYEVKSDDTDFSSATGTFSVPESTNLDVKLERTSTALYASDFARLNAAEWSAPGLLVKEQGKYVATISGTGITYLRDDKYRHYADFKLDVQSVNMSNGVAASFAVRVQDENNYYLIQLTGPKSDDHYKLRTFIVRGGQAKLLRTVSFEKHKDTLTPEAHVQLTISMTGQNLSVNLFNQDTGISFGDTSVLDADNTFSKGGVGFASLKGEKFEVGLMQVCGAKCAGQ